MESDPLTESQRTLLQYLEFVAGAIERNAPQNFRYRTYEKMVLDNASWFETNPESLDAERGQPKLCFANTFEFVWQNPAWFYCEGYAMCDDLMFPMLHAWAVDREGLVHDTTWDPRRGCTYFGIPLQFVWVREQILSTGHYGIIGNDWMNECPLLQSGFPDHAIAKEVNRG